jgi:hypothetical protein
MSGVRQSGQSEALTQALAAHRSIAYCGCGNLSVDGLNFSRAEGTADEDTLKCARCGAVSDQFLYLPASQAFQWLREAMLSDEAVRALANECWPNIPDSLPEKAKGARVALEAALDAIDPTRKGEQ